MDFKITTDSTCDLPTSYVAENELEILPLGCYIGEENFSIASDEKMKRFYEMVRQGGVPVTNQITPCMAEELFEKLVKAGNKILHIAFSSTLSGSHDSAVIAAQIINEKYGENSVVVVDSLCASMGEGLLIYYAHKLKNDGKTREEIVEWIEQNKLKICHYLTVDDLMHLHRGGRISKTTAIIGGALGIKPVLRVDDEGRIVPFSKERGKKNTLNEMVKIMHELTEGIKNEVVFIAHGDCIEDANYLADLIKKHLGIKNVVINMLGTTTGAHGGPGTVLLIFMGKHR